jgi:hypothetical protein
MNRLDFLKTAFKTAIATMFLPKLLIGNTSENNITKSCDIEEKEHGGLRGFVDYESFDEEILNSDFEYNAPKLKHPHIITIKNNGDDKLDNIIIGNAIKNLKAKNHGFPTEVSVSYKKSEDEILLYEDFLKSTIDKPFKNGRTAIQSKMGAQCIASVILSEGNTTKELIPTIDPYRQQSSIILYGTQYEVNGSLSIILSAIYPKNEVSIYFYELDPIQKRKINLNVRDWINPTYQHF